MNKLIVPGSKQALENLKYEIARELGITMGADQTSRLNGSVGGEMTKRLVELGKNIMPTQIEKDNLLYNIWSIIPYSKASSADK